MKCVFVSNILDHHSTQLCEELIKQFDSFCFIATDNANNYGYQSAEKADYVIPYYDENQKEKAIAAIVDADTVIYGGCPNSLIDVRMRLNKLSFLYSERFFKKGTLRRFIPSTKKALVERIGQYRDRSMYTLCASAYLPYDLSLIGFDSGKCFAWGYFPDTVEYENVSSLKKSEKTRFLWAGRLLGWKHPQMMISLAEKLRNDGYDFAMNIIGDGDLRKQLDEKIQVRHLSEYVTLLGSKSHREVRKYMEESHIFVTSSDYYEGWGAVLNEAMNSGCAVVASHAAGATPYLIEENVNGLVYQSKSIDDMYRKVKYLLDYPEEQIRLGSAAYKTIHEKWNAKVAAERFRILSEDYYAEKTKLDRFLEGPCCKAPIIKNNWYVHRNMNVE